MDNNASKAGWDVFLFGIPLIGFLIFGFFRLDQVFASRKSQTRGPLSAAPDKDSVRKSMATDPDGRPWDDQ
jgi:hypothetical protein